ncbi:MAG: efflux RND transporter periplasmic adaptor subunit [Halioglobus sp.]
MRSLNFCGSVISSLFIGCFPLSGIAQQDEPPTSLDCIIEPAMTIELSSSVNGVVRGVSVDKSDRVSKGQILATLESSVEEANVAIARARARMDDEVNAKRIDRDLSNTKKERVLELFRKKSAPGFEKDEVEAEAALAELALKRARSNKKMAELDLERSIAELNLRSIKSPVDGVVVERYVHPGESVKDRPLLRLAKIDPMRVEIIAYSELFGFIRKGMEAQIIIDGPQETRHTAKVSVVDGVVDAASGTFGIRLNLPNPDNSIVGGLKCTAKFELEREPQAR